VAVRDKPVLRRIEVAHLEAIVNMGITMAQHWCLCKTKGGGLAWIGMLYSAHSFDTSG